MSGKIPPRPQASKAERKVKVRQHERNLAPKFEPKQKRRPTLAERFRGQR